MISTLERRALCDVGGREGTATLDTSRRPREDEAEDEEGAAARGRGASIAGAATAPVARAPSVVFIGRGRGVSSVASSLWRRGCAACEK